MKSHQMQKQIAAFVLAALLMLAPGLAQAQTAQSQAAQAKPAPAKAAATEKEEPRGGPHEGIKVHGHWTIVLKNPDGSVASRHEIENALDSTSPVLGDLLGRTTVIGSWIVNLGAMGCSSGPNNALCAINEPGGSSNYCGGCAVQFFSNLTVSAANGSAILQGTATPPRSGLLSFVSTFVTECPRNGTPTYGLPATCGTSSVPNPAPFTFVQLTNPINVAAGQIVQVTVTFSFS